MGAIFILDLILSTARTRGKISQRQKSELNSFFTQYPLPSSTTKSPLHTKLLVTVLSALIGACVDLLHSLSTGSMVLRSSHFTWALVVLLTSETGSSHLQVRHTQPEQCGMRVIVYLAFDLGSGIWLSVTGVSGTPYVAQKMLSLLRLLASFPNAKIVTLSYHTCLGSFLLLLLFFFLHVYVCLGTCVHMVVCSWHWVSSLMALYVIVAISCWRTRSSLIPASRAIWNALGYLSLPLKCWDPRCCHLCLTFYMDARDPKTTGPHACTASTLSFWAIITLALGLVGSIILILYTTLFYQIDMLSHCLLQSYAYLGICATFHQSSFFVSWVIVNVEITLEFWEWLKCSK